MMISCLSTSISIIDLGRYGKIPSEQLIGLKAGLYYEVLPGNKLGPLSPTDVHPELSNTASAEDEEMATNEAILDDNQAQRLTTEEIEALKALHATGEASATVLKFSMQDAHM